MLYLSSILPVLACPLVMVILIWLFMRGGQEQALVNTSQPLAEQESERKDSSWEGAPLPEPVALRLPRPSLFKTIWECMQMCLNWKILVGLLGVAILIAVLAPNAFAAALPVLLILVCPLSMGIMLLRMGSMRSTAQATVNTHASCPACVSAQAESTQPHQDLEQPTFIQERPPTLPLL